MAHRDTCDLKHPGTPAAALAIIKVDHDLLRYLVLGDVTLVVETNDGLRIVTDSRVDATANVEREAADALPSGSQDKTEALVRMKHAELAARNIPGGYWLAAADPIAVSYALTGEVPLKTIHRAAMLTDGAVRAVNPFKLYGWSDLLSALASDGPGNVIDRVRIAETADSDGIQQPRNKIHDDATIAIIQL